MDSRAIVRFRLPPESPADALETRTLGLLAENVETAYQRHARVIIVETGDRNRRSRSLTCVVLPARFS